MRKLAVWSLALQMMIISLSTPSLAIAQQALPVPTPLCMARTANSPDRHPIAVIVPIDQQAAMEARGFATFACGSSRQGGVYSYRDKICEWSTKAPKGVQTQFASVHGASMEELCTLANRAIEQIR